ncbi:MAG: AAA family ATPase [Syntrophorhabdaceae bacterium]|nr:AAA family ATPase [Syntrophorhabdaceae bacterium]
MEIPYIEHFGFSEKPFGMSPDPSFYYESVEHKQAIDYLTFFIAQQEGFALIYGDVGSGKTTISRIFLNTLDQETYNTALILNPVADEAEFMKEVLREFSAGDIPETKKELYDRLRHYLLDEFQKGKMNVLVIDEAQLLSYDLLEFIRLLSNIETDKQKILHTVFFAQPEFLGKLKDPVMRHLSQRITVTYRIKPLTYAEVKAYINYRLFKAGAKGPLEFQERAMKLIHTASRGYPRLINYICDRCLLVLYAASSYTVDGHVVSKVILEESIPLSTTKHSEDSRRLGLRRPILVGGIISVLILGVAVYCFMVPGARGFFSSGKPHTPQVSAAQTAAPPVAPVAQAPAAAASTSPAPAHPVPPVKAPPKTDIVLKRVYVNTEAANVRSRPDINSPRIGVIIKNETLRVIAEKADADKLRWYKIKLYEGREGWIAESVVTEKR